MNDLVDCLYVVNRTVRGLTRKGSQYLSQNNVVQTEQSETRFFYTCPKFFISGDDNTDSPSRESPSTRLGSSYLSGDPEDLEPTLGL